MGAKKIDTFTQSSDHQGQNSVAVEFLSLAGFTLYGNEWIVPLAAELGISPSEIRNWLAGKTPLTMEAAIWPRVIEALRGREETLGRILGETRAAVRAANEEAGEEVSQAPDGSVKPLHILR
jgi:hypothetical protein